MIEEVGRPITEGVIRIKRVTPETDYDGQLDSIWAEVRPLLNFDTPLSPNVLMSMMCGCSGKVAQHLAKDETQEARDLILAQISYAVRALKQLPRPN